MPRPCTREGGNIPGQVNACAVGMWVAHALRAIRLIRIMFLHPKRPVYDVGCCCIPPVLPAHRAHKATIKPQLPGPDGRIKFYKYFIKRFMHASKLQLRTCRGRIHDAGFQLPSGSTVRWGLSV